MSLLADYHWQIKYDSDSASLVREFYEPALSCAVRYDRSTGFFSANLLTLAARGIENLVRNSGRMRLVIGCTISAEEVEAIEKGEKLRDIIDRKMISFPLDPQSPYETDALELLSWMIAHDHLDIKLALPCSTGDRKPIPSFGIFHEKAGIIEDRVGDRLAFNGSINETAMGWKGNWESFHVFTGWTGSKSHVDEEENSFAKLWNNQAKRCLVIDVPTAMREQLLKFLPANDNKPQRLQDFDEPLTSSTIIEDTSVNTNTNHDIKDINEKFKQIWQIIHHGASIPGKGDRIGEATANIKPFPHQIRAFQRLYNHYPPKLLIADEVGLGKTIEAGLLLRQAWLSGKAKRILILAPKSVLTQWQIELREKFNLNIPIYDGKTLSWYDCPALRALGNSIEKTVNRQDWHKEAIVIVSSHLMRRTDRAKELLEDSEPYDLIFLDEAHHARRQGDKGANQLLRLMQRLKEKTQGLVLLTATPMQVDPIEVWDLLNLLGLPTLWDGSNFQRFFEYASVGNPSHEQFEFMSKLFRAVETHFGETTSESVMRYIQGGSKLTAKNILKALRDEAQLPRRQLRSEHRRAAITMMRANTPVAKLISRHTRELLRRYYEEGKISSRIATRNVYDEFVALSSNERTLYEAVEDYISTTYNNASIIERNAVGFVMTIYRRRLASSFAALTHTLSQRVEKIQNSKRGIKKNELNIFALSEDISDDETEDEVMDIDTASQLEQEALKREEVFELELLRDRVRQLPTDTKAKILLQKLKELQAKGYQQVIIFTQYTDTMDFLRKFLLKSKQPSVICFSGRGGELPGNDGSWRKISRDETKRIFREGQADILLCTDAAAEGLNFQFCGALINYDMPWNPMRVEQRIGRIDRLGQVFESIEIVNLHYRDTVEADVYIALRERIGLFSQYVGKLQPILASLPKSIASVALANRNEREKQRDTLLSEIDENRRKADTDSFDLDAITDADLEEPPRSDALYDLEALDLLLHHTDLLPPGIEVSSIRLEEYKFSMPGMSNPLRITTNSNYFDQHPESVELWSPGSPLFPNMQGEADEAYTNAELKHILQSLESNNIG
jgi:SNF2 family DNA or RNA helicase